MILAAGRGTRMGTLTDDTPKPLLTIAGKTLIEYHLEALAAMDIREVVINVSYRASQIMDYLGDGQRWGVSIAYSHEPKALETAGGIHHALPLLGDQPFLVVNADVFLARGYPELSPLNGDDQAHLWLTDNPDHHPNGDFALYQGRIARSQPRFTFTGLSILSPSLFADMQPGPLPLLPVLLKAIEADRVSGSLLAGWLDVGTPQRRQQAQHLVQARMSS
ncbi:N-acetylmuramate alpha-1-phosphate uridylyltransferase MurU [Bacterioplanes sanyensis]